MPATGSIRKLVSSLSHEFPKQSQRMEGAGVRVSGYARELSNIPQ